MSEERRAAFISAVDSGDAESVAAIWNSTPDLFAGTPLKLESYFRWAVRGDHADVVRQLAELGADINFKERGESPHTGGSIIRTVAIFGRIKCARWLLENGADINFELELGPRCVALENAAGNGHLDIVKLMIENGAWYNYRYGENNPLAKAQMYGHTEVADYLISIGAKLPEELEKPKGIKAADELPQSGPPGRFLDHLSTYFGSPEADGIRQVIPTVPEITIVVIRNESGVVLVTQGMSTEPISLPAGWPVTKDSLADATYGWPADCLRRIAVYPHLKDEPFGYYVTVPNGLPAKPLSPETKMSALLAIQAMEDYGRFEDDGKTIVFYNVMPIYAEEHNLVENEGVVSLLKRFEANEVGIQVDIKRPNTAVAN